jgi:hypothetical protein
MMPEDDKFRELWADLDDNTKNVLLRVMTAAQDFKNRGLTINTAVLKSLFASAMAMTEVDPLRPTPKYKVGDRVTVQGWGSSATGTVRELHWVYHNRMEEYVWGYAVTFDPGQSNPLTMHYVPQGYLRPLEVQVSDPPA